MLRMDTGGEFQADGPARENAVLKAWQKLCS